jgi:hypothetical protein
MSWEQAMREAEDWLLACGVPRHQGIKGQYFDLHEKGDLIIKQGQFRTMILRAAERIMKKRGATAWYPE